MCILPLVWCHCRPVWPTAHSLNITYVWRISFETVTGEPAWCRLLIFHTPLLRSLVERIRPSPRLTKLFRTILAFYGEGFLALHQNTMREDHPLHFVRGCFFIIFAITLHSCRPYLHPQPEDGPCCGDKATHPTWKISWHRTLNCMNLDLLLFVLCVSFMLLFIHLRPRTIFGTNLGINLYKRIALTCIKFVEFLKLRTNERIHKSKILFRKYNSYIYHIHNFLCKRLVVSGSESHAKHK
jgi:hypothetical protein